MTEKVHFDDLTKINVCIGLLDEDTRKRFFDAGGPYEAFAGVAGWVPANGTVFHGDRTYRLKPEPLTKPSVPWDALLADYVARDSNGKVYAFKDRPELGPRMWHGAEVSILTGFIRHDPGTCDWRDSLVVRPGKEDEE